MVWKRLRLFRRPRTLAANLRLQRQTRVKEVQRGRIAGRLIRVHPRLQPVPFSRGFKGGSPPVGFRRDGNPGATYRPHPRPRHTATPPASDKTTAGAAGTRQRGLGRWTDSISPTSYPAINSRRRVYRFAGRLFLTAVHTAGRLPTKTHFLRARVRPV